MTTPVRAPILAVMEADQAGLSAQPEVVLMCGVAGSGKTTYAKDLETRGYVRLSVDEEIWRRFGSYGVDYEPDKYEEHTEGARRVLRERLLSLVAQGSNVVIDSSFKAAGVQGADRAGRGTLAPHLPGNRSGTATAASACAC